MKTVTGKYGFDADFQDSFDLKIYNPLVDTNTPKPASSDAVEGGTTALETPSNLAALSNPVMVDLTPDTNEAPSAPSAAPGLDDLPF
jgi:hypothetical protein